MPYLIKRKSNYKKPFALFVGLYFRISIKLISFDVSDRIIYHKNDPETPRCPLIKGILPDNEISYTSTTTKLVVEILIRFQINKI